MVCFLRMLNCDVSVMCNVDSLSTPYHIYCSSCSCRIALQCIATTLCVTFWYTKFDGTKIFGERRLPCNSDWGHTTCFEKEP